MRLLILCSLLLCTSSVQAQGFLRSIRERVENTVNNAVDEVRSITNQEINDVNQDVSQSTDGIVQDVLPQVPVGVGVSATGTAAANPLSAVASGDSSGLPQGVLPDPLEWGTPSGNALRAIDQEIQGLRLGMPAMEVDRILQERGYQRTVAGQYQRQQTNDQGLIVRTQRIGILAVEPSQEFIDELADGELKDRVLAAQRLIDENRQAAQASTREARSRDARQRAGSSDVPGSLELVYLIQYQQIYNQDFQQFDLDAAISQARSVFGASTFPDDTLRRGLAFNTSPQTTLLYHDASLLPIDYRNSLVEGVPGVRAGHKEAVYNALRVPCGGPENPWGPPGGGGCPPGWADAYPDFDQQLELNRAILSPFLRIKGIDGRAGIETRLEWAYLQGERAMREAHAEQVARDNAPPAQLDF